MNNRADGVMVAYPLFQAEGGGSTPTSALQLRIYKCSFEDARQLNRSWHSRLPKFPTRKFASLCYGAQFDGRWFAVAIWSNPVARMLPQGNWLELRRLAISPDAPKNTASRMLSVMTRLIRDELPNIEKLISYQDTAVHTGTIYRAAGWKPTNLSAGGEWTRPSRSRPPVQSDSAKQRWEKDLYGDAHA